MTNPFQFSGISCDQEPIHIPGSIQAHGMMLVAEQESLLVRQGAGAIELRLGAEEWEGRHLNTLIGTALSEKIALLLMPGAEGGFQGQLKSHSGEMLDVSAHLSGPYLIIELELTNFRLSVFRKCDLHTFQLDRVDPDQDGKVFQLLPKILMNDIAGFRHLLFIWLCNIWTFLKKSRHRDCCSSG